MASTTSTRTPKPQAPEFPRPTQESHQEVLDIRREAMKGFAEGTVDQATKALARKAVRESRNARNAWEKFDQEMAAWKAANPPKPRTKKAVTA